MIIRPHRRQILAGTAAIGVFGAASGRAQSGYLFTLGVASGAPRPGGFVIWTRIAPDPLAPDGGGGVTAPVEVDWIVAEDPALTRVVARGRETTDAAWGHSLHVEVGGLRPGRPYWYRFYAAGQESALGRAQTAPAPGAAVPRLKLALASCSNWQVGWFSAYRHMAEEAPDLTLFLGDYIYEYSYPTDRPGLVRQTENSAECRSLVEYRNRYALHRTDPDLQSLHAAAPCQAIWDDHEVHNDYGADFSQFATVSEAEFRSRRLAAYQAFYEHMPLPASARPTSQDMRLFGRLDFGDLAQINLLDTRQYRAVQPCQVGQSRRAHVAPLACAEFGDPGRSMLGAAQEAWLYDQFRAAQAPRWNLIAQTVLFSPYQQRDGNGETGYYTDNWSGYGGNRTRLIQALAGAGRQDNIFFGGDLHAFLVSDVKTDFADERSPAIGAEFIGTSITSNGPGAGFGETMDLNPHARFFDGDWRGYMTAELTPERCETKLRAISDRTDPNATVSTLQAFVVESGDGGVKPG